MSRKFVLAALVFAACSSSTANPRLALRYEKDLQQLDAASFAARATDKDVQVFDLGRTAWVSHHVAVVRTAESPHYHRFHDLTVTVLSGEGALDLEGRKIPMKAGDVAHVNRGIRHYFRNGGKSPAVAFVVFSPPYDGRDTVTADLPEVKAPVETPKKRWWWPFGKKRSAPDESTAPHENETPSESSPQPDAEE
jgi:mannose-6-phosphate isomerase-like protein (cupin superfamily)